MAEGRIINGFSTHCPPSNRHLSHVPTRTPAQPNHPHQRINLLVSLDSRFETIDDSVKLKIEKAPFQVKLLQQQSHSHFNTLRQKLNWGFDIRN
jgi:NAD kinase